jgi:hypothetical protein
MEIERALERAMQAEDPGPAFTARVVTAVGAASAPPDAVPVATHRSRHRLRWTVLPLAATVALGAAGIAWQAKQAEEVRARAVQAQLVQALRLTGETLNVVHRAIERSQE